MDMPKLLIADSSDEFRQILFDDLCKTYTVQTCRDGIHALELLRSFQPDILILDLLLPGLDGISLLHRANSEGLSPAVLALSTFGSEYIISALQRLDVSYLMTKPCDLTAISDRLADLASALQPAQVSQADINSSATNLLLHLGFSARLNGFLFLQAGIPMYMRDPAQSMTKELYVSIGALYGKDARQVERSIRNAIDSAWQHRDDAVWRQYFYAPGGAIPRPSNNEFFARMAAALSQQGYGSKRA